jgi:hypothetical protein
MGQNLPLCGQLGAARSRQDESKEVGGVGSKRTSSGCNGVHVVRWIGLIFRLLSIVLLQTHSNARPLIFWSSGTKLRRDDAPFFSDLGLDIWSCPASRHWYVVQLPDPDVRHAGHLPDFLWEEQGSQAGSQILRVGLWRT